LAAILIDSLINIRFPGIFFSLAFLAIIYAKPLGIQAVVPGGVLGAALLLSIGFSLIFRNRKHHYHAHKWDGETEFTYIEDEQDGSCINYKSSFAGAIKYVNSDSFTRANLKNSFGSLKVYFDNAIIDGDKAVIYVNDSFGEIELYFPRDWKVINNVNTSFADAKMKNRASGADTKTVEIVGDVSFGDLKIYFD
jgi:predicted membrane protein